MPTPEREHVTEQLLDEMIRFMRLLKASAASATALERSSLLLLWPLHEGPLRLRELAEAKGVDQSTVSRQAAQLVQAGLVRRDPDPADRRAFLLSVTERGRAACREMMESRRRAIAEALGDWDADQIIGFVRMFRDFNHAVEKHTASSQEIM